MGVARFRWLLTAIDQNTAGMLDFFLEWREFRLQNSGGTRRIRPAALLSDRHIPNGVSVVRTLTLT